MDKGIYVTKTYLPPLDEYNAYLKSIWKKCQVTNHGVFVNELEEKLRRFLRVKHLFLVSNGMTGLQIAIKVLGLKGEVITSPFSYVASVSSLFWENCKPVFADIDPETLCISPEEIVRKISQKTRGILATHVYGIPCAVEKIKKIAEAHNIKVIYDAAHAFGVSYGRKSILHFGDVSVLSFHATKLFHTVEGGAVVTDDDDLAHKISYSRNFGHKGEESFWGPGINGKNSELHAAMGLCIYPKIKWIINQRKKISRMYDNMLSDLCLIRPVLGANVTYNYAYYPVIFSCRELVLKVKKALNEVNIFPRRYFYPSLNNLPYLKRQDCSCAESVSERVLCLPLSHDLTREGLIKITSVIRQCMKNK